MKRKICRKLFYSFKFGGWYYVWLRISSKLLKNDKAYDYLYRKSKDTDPEQYETELMKIYSLRTGRKLNLKDPQTFNEKIQWLKLYDSTQLKTTLADKYLVREWIREKIGEQYLIPLLGVWDRFEQIDINKLPESFVLKANHGSGFIVVVKDKKRLNWDAIQNKFNKWMHINYAFKDGFELQYLNISPKIIAEKYVESSDGSLYDYKIHCFNGVPKYVELLGERNFDTHYVKDAYYDTEWILQPFDDGCPSWGIEIEKPDKLEEMLQIAGILCKDFAYVRVDLYELNNGEIKFGEMTFTPASGLRTWNPPETDYMLGKMIELPQKSVIPCING